MDRKIEVRKRFEPQAADACELQGDHHEASETYRGDEEFGTPSMHGMTWLCADVCVCVRLVFDVSMGQL